MRRLLALLPALALLVVAGTAPAPALDGAREGLAAAVSGTAQPVKCRTGDVTVDGRVFPEPRFSAAFLRLPDFECGIAFLERTFPDRIEMVSLGKSAGGHDVWDVRLTDETVEGDKEKLLVVSSIHGNEIGAREGAARQIEDLLDPTLQGEEDWVREVLATHVIHFVFPNPDGWVRGDLYGAEGSGVAWTRANTGSRDLNRNFPVSGWINPGNNPLDQPESRLVDDLLRSSTDWSLGTDNHGQIMQTEQPTAASGLQIVGQFDYQKSETLARFGDAINGAMAEYGVLDVMEELNQGTGGLVAPYRWGTLYDVLGYSASGSLIDYYNTVDGIGGTGFATELSVSNHQAANAAVPMQTLNQLWVDSTRAINTTMFKQAIDPIDFTFPLGGTVAYVDDPKVVTSADGVGFTGTPEQVERFGQADYEVTRMQFFRDLDAHASGPVTPLSVEALLADPALLDDVDSLVLSDEVMPIDGEAAEADRAAWTALLDGWVRGGGNLVVLDGAARILPELGVVPETAVTVANHYVGAVTGFTDRSHPLNSGLRGIASQTYDTVPIGYRFGSTAQNSAPNWKVSRAAWEAAGGYTAGTNGTGQTIYGQLPLDEGRISFLGALLPQPTEEHYHPFGLQNYAVTYTGYTLLENMLDYARP
jgi:hypothetical protein